MVLGKSISRHLSSLPFCYCSPFQLSHCHWLFLTLFSASCSYGFALYTNKPSQDIDNGMYGLNGALIALFIGNFFDVNAWLILVVALGSLITVPIAKIVFSFKKYRGYTSAFIVTSWSIYMIQSDLNLPFFHTLKHYVTVGGAFWHSMIG